MTPEQLNVVDRAAKREYDAHIGRLLAAGDAIQSYDPRSPASVNRSYEEFLIATHRAIAEYGQQFVAQVSGVTAKVLPAVREQDKAEILKACRKYLSQELYGKRLEIFESGLGRKAQSYSQKIDPAAHRFDLLRSRYAVGSANLIARAINHLGDELQVLVLEASAGESSPEQSNNVLSETEWNEQLLRVLEGGPLDSSDYNVVKYLKDKGHTDSPIAISRMRESYGKVNKCVWLGPNASGIDLMHTLRSKLTTERESQASAVQTTKAAWHEGALGKLILSILGIVLATMLLYRIGPILMP